MQFLKSKLYFQYSVKQRLVQYLAISIFIGLVAFAIASFHPTPMIGKLIVGGSFALGFGLAAVFVSELRIAFLHWKKKSEFHFTYGEFWFLGLITLIIGFFILGCIQIAIRRINISETDFYFDPVNGFIPFSLQFFSKLIVPTIIDIFLVGHVILKKVRPQQKILTTGEEKLITITSGKNSVSLNPKNVTHISVIQHYATFYLKTIEGNDEVELKSSLVNILKQLPPDSFIKVHRAHVVNVVYIDKIINHSGQTSVLIKSGQEPIPVSRRQFRELKEIHEAYLERIRKIPVPNS